MSHKIVAAGNTIVPAIHALERRGFTVSVQQSGGADEWLATRADEAFQAPDPLTVLGLVALVEAHGWAWQVSDEEFADVMRRHALD